MSALVAGAAPGAPAILSASPTDLSTLGGGTVTIKVQNSDRIASVKIGGVAASALTVVDSQTITVTAGAHAAGSGHEVRLTDTYGADAVLTNQVTFHAPPTPSAISPASGTAAGGTSVDITVDDSTGATGAKVGGVSLTSFTIVNATTVRGTTGAHAAGAVNVTVTNAYGTGTLTNGYTYT